MEIVRQKNVATIITFPIVDADGDAVTGAADLDTEIDTWTDAAVPDGFADATNEATEIGATGIYYLSLTQAEMNNDYIYVQVKTSTAGAKTQHILIRTMVGDPLLLATTTGGAVAALASALATAQADLDTITDADGVIIGAAGATAIVDEFETQSQADPTGFHVNVLEVGGTAQTANDNGADINAILTDTNELQTDWVNGGRLDLIIDAIVADTNELQADDYPTSIAAVKAVVDAILVDTGTTLENHLLDIKGTGFAKDTHSLPQCLTATGFSTHSAADVKTAMEAAGSDLDYLVIALVNKQIITKASGNIEQFTDAGVSIGTIAGAITSDATTVTRLRMVQ